jgi:hypothetical protein
LKILKNKINDKIEKKKKTIKEEFIPIPSAADFRNQLKVAVKKDKAHINKIKTTIKAETKNNKSTDEEIYDVVDVWDSKELPRISFQNCSCRVKARPTSFHQLVTDTEFYRRMVAHMQRLVNQWHEQWIGVCPCFLLHPCWSEHSQAHDQNTQLVHSASG